VAQTPPSLLFRLRDRPGDAAAWQRFDDIYRPLLTSWLRRHGLQDHDLEDLLQDILATVVRELPQFEYDPDKGRFRGWLRTILVNRLRSFWRRRQSQARPAGTDAFALQVLAQLEAPDGELGRLWDQEHDRHVMHRLLALVRRDFAPRTWQAFERLLAGEKPAAVAAALDLSVNAVYLARSGIIKRLREEAAGLVD
jgi:RNA polymerase sigma-70 factor (ECF subfamily)